MPCNFISRRKFISRFVGISSTSFGILSLLSCDRKPTVEKRSETKAVIDPCDDLSGVSQNDLALRQKLNYVNESPIEDNKCNNCNLFLPSSSNQKCGGCMLFKGPVYATGYCTYWAPKV
jgi:hypothetical protein